MQFIVVGCTMIGSRLAQVMAEEGHDVIVIDQWKENFKRLGSDFSGLTVFGVPSDEDVLRNAGIENADGLAAATADDNVNIMVCQIAKQFFKVPQVLTTIHDPDRGNIFYQFGVDTVCPTTLAVESMRHLMLEQENYSSCFIENTSVNFYYAEVKDHQIGSNLKDYEPPNDSMLFGLLRDGVLFFPDDTLTLEENDSVVLVRKAKGDSQ